MARLPRLDTRRLQVRQIAVIGAGWLTGLALAFLLIVPLAREVLSWV